MVKPLLPPAVGKTPTKDGHNVVVMYANLNGQLTWCDILFPIGQSWFRVRPIDSDDTAEIAVVQLTNGTTANPGEGWIKFVKEDKSEGYAKSIFDTVLKDFDDNTLEWHAPGINDQTKGVYVSSNYDDVKKD